MPCSMDPLAFFHEKTCLAALTRETLPKVPMRLDGCAETGEERNDRIISGGTKGIDGKVIKESFFDVTPQLTPTSPPATGAADTTASAQEEGGEEEQEAGATSAWDATGEGAGGERSDGGDEADPPASTPSELPPPAAITGAGSWETLEDLRLPGATMERRESTRGGGNGLEVAGTVRGRGLGDDGDGWEAGDDGGVRGAGVDSQEEEEKSGKIRRQVLDTAGAGVATAGNEVADVEATAVTSAWRETPKARRESVSIEMESAVVGRHSAINVADLAEDRKGGKSRDGDSDDDDVHLGDTPNVDFFLTGADDAANTTMLMVALTDPVEDSTSGSSASSRAVESGDAGNPGEELKQRGASAVSGTALTAPAGDRDAVVALLAVSLLVGKSDYCRRISTGGGSDPQGRAVDAAGAAAIPATPASLSTSFVADVGDCHAATDLVAKWQSERGEQGIGIREDFEVGDVRGSEARGDESQLDRSTPKEGGGGSAEASKAANPGPGEIEGAQPAQTSSIFVSPAVLIRTLYQVAV